jgi:hypothetical protein
MTVENAFQALKQGFAQYGDELAKWVFGWAAGRKIDGPLPAVVFATYEDDGRTLHIILPGGEAIDIRVGDREPPCLTLRDYAQQDFVDELSLPIDPGELGNWTNDVFLAPVTLAKIHEKGGV